MEYTFDIQGVALGCTQNDGSSCEEWKKFKPRLLSVLHILRQAICEVAVIVGFEKLKLTGY